MSDYTNSMLLLFGLAGILLHCLVKIYELKQKGAFAASKYFSDEWPSICIATVMVVIAIFVKREIKELDVTGNYIGLGFVAIGYMGQSILKTFIGKAAGKVGVAE